MTDLAFPGCEAQSIPATQPNFRTKDESDQSGTTEVRVPVHGIRPTSDIAAPVAGAALRRRGSAGRTRVQRPRSLVRLGGIRPIRFLWRLRILNRSLPAANSIFNLLDAKGRPYRMPKMFCGEEMRRGAPRGS